MTGRLATAAALFALQELVADIREGLLEVETFSARSSDGTVAVSAECVATIGAPDPLESPLACPACGAQAFADPGVDGEVVCLACSLNFRPGSLAEEI
jgi:hypothetical protein